MHPVSLGNARMNMSREDSVNDNGVKLRKRYNVVCLGKWLIFGNNRVLSSVSINLYANAK